MGMGSGLRTIRMGRSGGRAADGREKFGTYTRDSVGQDYADQRYYAVGTGRFNVPDPYQASAGAEDPGSWNRYAYVGGDPINYLDPSGLNAQRPGYCSAEYSYSDCAELGIFSDGGVPGVGVGGGNSPGLNIGLFIQYWQGQGFSVFPVPMPPVGPAAGGIGIVICGASGACEVIAIAAAGAAASAAAVYGAWELGRWIGRIYRDRVQPNSKPVPTIEDIQRDCTAGQVRSEPATGKRYKGARSFEQDYACPDGTYTIHWIVNASGNIVHGPHIRVPGSRQ